MKIRITSFILTALMVITLLPVLPVNATSISIGEYAQMGTYYGKPIVWRCVDIDENGPLMLSDKIICIKPFDARTGLNSTTGSHSIIGYYRTDYGSNYWADSNIRSWLISNASAGKVEWLCGNPPSNSKVYQGYNEYDQEAGFLTNFTDTEKSVVKTVTQKSIVAIPEINNGIYTEGSEQFIDNQQIDTIVQNYDNAYAEQVTDSFFLLDVKQVYKVYQNGNILGDDYYIGEPTQEAVDNSEFKDSSLRAGYKWHYWLRTPSTQSGNGPRYVVAKGIVRNLGGAVSTNIGIRPAFYLNQQSAIRKSGDGSQINPYVIDGIGTSEPTEVDKSALMNAVNTAKAVDSAKYTESSYSTLTAAIKTAESVLEDENAAAEEVENAKIGIMSAIFGLVEKSEDITPTETPTETPNGESTDVPSEEPTTESSETPSEVPSETPAGESIPVIGDYNGRVTVSDEITDNAVTFTITPISGDVAQFTDIKLFIAEYDSDSSLRNINFGENEVIDNKLRITAELPKSNNYKIMLWDKNLTPITDVLKNIQ